MNELSLSNDLSQIELEINHHKQIAGQSIWEIGRRLNHVKENDLAHGQFGKWLEKINLGHAQANKYMKVANELPNSYSGRNIGVNALYLISTLPEEQKQEELNKVEEGNPSTTRELQKLKQQISLKEKRIQSLTQTNEDLEFQASQKQQVIEKEVIKEVPVIPHDYDGLKSDNQQLSQALKEARIKADAAIERNEFIENQYNILLKERAEVNEKSEKYEELSKAIKTAKGKLDSTQKLISDYKDILKLLRLGNDLLTKLGGLNYLDISQTVNNSVVISSEFDSMIRSLERLTRDLSNIRRETIMEGEIIND